MKAVILAGGKGTRLNTPGIPKSMQKIGNKYLLEHQLNLLKKYGFMEIILLTGYYHSRIAEYFRDGKASGLDIRYYRDTLPLGTAGALKSIENVLAGNIRNENGCGGAVSVEDFLLLYGDIMLNIDLGKLVDFHLQKQAFCTAVVHPNDHPADSDLLEADNNARITAFSPKPHAPGACHGNMATAALFVLSPRICRYIPPGSQCDLVRDIFPRIIKQETCYTYRTRAYLKDIGTPGRLKQVKADYASGKIAAGTQQRKAIFLDRDGVINEQAGLIYKPEDFKLIPNAAEAIKRINASPYLAVVITNQPGIARNLCSEKELQEIHNKMETLLGRENAYLDRIYYCPHHPDKGFPEENKAYKIPCTCRKPGTGMIEKAAAELDIQREGSYMIGDTEKDILCGMRAGLKTILVAPPSPAQDGKVKPHFQAPDLAAAVALILQEEAPL